MASAHFYPDYQRVASSTVGLDWDSKNIVQTLPPSHEKLECPRDYS